MDEQERLEYEQSERRPAQAPYTKGHPVPTVQKYHREQEERRQLENPKPDDEGGLDKLKRKLHLSHARGDSHSPYNAQNRNEQIPAPPEAEAKDETDRWQHEQVDNEAGNSNTKDSKPSKRNGSTNNATKDTTESHTVSGGDARQKRKAMKKRQPKGTREVTDPVTHLPVAFHDFTDKDLDATPENFGAPDSHPSSSTSTEKSEKDIQTDRDDLAKGDRGTRRVFPPPSFNAVRNEMIRITQKALLLWVSGAFGLLALTIPTAWGLRWLSQDHAWYVSVAPVILIAIGSIAGLVVHGLFLRTWLQKHVEETWDNEIWEAARAEEMEQVESPAPESTQWLNRLFASVWPLINPDLFTSMADMVEDVMQASLPRFVRMVAVEDFGQGSEAFRILGIRWLPTGAAAKSVDVDGKIKDDDDGPNDRKVQGDGQTEALGGSKDRQNGETGDQADDEGETQAQNDEATAEGLEKEEGEFVNMEIAFAYRATSTDKKLSSRAKNAHLLIKFYLPGSLPIPIWVTLQGIVGVMRMRLQLTPDPPFVSLATITLIGQPKAEMQAIPLTKHFLNVMDLPFISGFVQSSIDAALAEYVAPRSLTLNLKEMLMGDDFKKDTNARGVIMVHIKKAYNFKEADPGIPGIKSGSSDPYITVGWAKFGKPVWSSRLLLSTMDPVWDETAFLLVTPEEVNAEERLRLQLWDSDRFTADDDEGRIEVDLKELMRDKKTVNQVYNRKDGFLATKADEEIPGTLEWSVGYYPKVKLTDKQIKQQKAMPKIQDREALRKFNEEEAERKMREAHERHMAEEVDQNKEAGLAEKEIAMIASAPPPEGFASGIFSIQLHNITGLHLQLLQKDRNEARADGTEGSEVSDDLPSAFATVILNGQKVFKTRTKPKNSKPFFNASTERMIRDWRNTEVMISVRDARVHEDDALIGLVFLKLGDVFKKHSQVNNTYPLVGGIGFGRIRISMVFRACTLQLPRELQGWEFGTLEIGTAKSDDLAQDLRGMRIKVKGPINKGKIYSSEGNQWAGKNGEHLKLGTRNRYSSCITLEFRKTISGPDKTAAFGIFWLKNISDNDAKVIEIPIWRGGRSKEFYKMRTHCQDECGLERSGTLKIDMKHWSGLSEYHRPLAKQNRNMHDVMEVLDTAHDNLELRSTEAAKPGPGDPDKDSSSDSESSDAHDSGSDYDDDEASSLKNSKPPQEEGDGRLRGHSEDQGEDVGKRGPMEQLKDFNSHRQTLNRQHRGVMQWRAPRTAKWMKHKMESGKDKLVGLVAHHNREPDVETEV